VLENKAEGGNIGCSLTESEDRRCSEKTCATVFVFTVNYIYIKDEVCFRDSVTRFFS
jgi:hypothetical protein